MATPVSPTFIAFCGFEHPNPDSFSAALDRIQPSGGTALLDGILESNRKLKKLYDSLRKKGSCEGWKAVHIVVTDAEENKSHSSAQWVKFQCKECMNAAGHFVWDNFVYCILQDGSLVTRDESERAKLENLNQPDHLFQPLFTTKEHLRSQLNSLYTSLPHPTAVLLTIDVSYSMQDCWDEVKTELVRFVRKLQAEDLLGVTCFHEDVMTLDQASISIRENPPEEVRPSSREPPPQSSMFELYRQFCVKNCLLS